MYTLYLICKREKESTREKKIRNWKLFFMECKRFFSFFPVLYEYFKPVKHRASIKNHLSVCILCAWNCRLDFFLLVGWTLGNGDFKFFECFLGSPENVKSIRCMPSTRRIGVQVAIVMLLLLKLNSLVEFQYKFWN